MAGHAGAPMAGGAGAPGGIGGAPAKGGEAGTGGSGTAQSGSAGLGGSPDVAGSAGASLCIVVYECNDDDPTTDDQCVSAATGEPCTMTAGVHCPDGHCAHMPDAAGMAGAAGSAGSDAMGGAGMAGAPPECVTNNECSDGDPCNGAETCNAKGKCSAGDPPNLDDGDVCTIDACDPSTGVTHTMKPAISGCGSTCPFGYHISEYTCVGKEYMMGACGPCNGPNSQNWTVCLPNCG